MYTSQINKLSEKFILSTFKPHLFHNYKCPPFTYFNCMAFFHSPSRTIILCNKTFCLIIFSSNFYLKLVVVRIIKSICQPTYVYFASLSKKFVFSTFKPCLFHNYKCHLLLILIV